MKINVDQPLIGLDGKPLMDGSEKWTLGSLAIFSLVNMSGNDRQVDNMVKFERGELASKLYVGGDVDLSQKEVEMMKERVGFMFDPRHMTPAWRLIKEAEDRG